MGRHKEGLKALLCNLPIEKMALSVLISSGENSQVPIFPPLLKKELKDYNPVEKNTHLNLKRLSVQRLVLE